MSSTTQAAIFGIARIFDADKVQREINAQVQITQTFGREASKAVANFAVSKIDEIKAQQRTEPDPEKRQALKAEQQKWEEGGIYRIALHTAVGGLSGGVQGAAGAATAASAASILDDLQDSIARNLEQAGANSTIAKAAGQFITGITAAGIGSVASGGSTAGAATAFNSDANNRQLHPTEIQWIKANARRYAQQKGISPQEAEKRLAQQAYRQVQDGAAGNWDADASHFLKQAHGMLPADGGSGPGYMFQATATQKADGNMYANQLPQTAAFYEKNGIRLPTAQQAADATMRGNDIRDAVGKATVGAAALAATTTLPPALSFCLSNPVACNQIVIAGGEIAAGDALGPAGLAIGSVAAGKMGLKSMQSAEQANARMIRDGMEAAWAKGTAVINAELKPGTRVQMVLSEAQYQKYQHSGDIPIGGWATFDNVASQATAKQDLALLKKFKPDTKYVIELEVVKSIKADIGFVGKQTEPAGQVLQGGLTQAAFDWKAVGYPVNRAEYLKPVGKPVLLPVLSK